MTISDEIIEKFQLTDSYEQIGESFIQNLRVFKSGLEQLEDCRFMECDLQGKPSKYITIYNRHTKMEHGVTSEFIKDATVETIIQIVTQS
jgi:hypothetical protein